MSFFFFILLTAPFILSSGLLQPLTALLKSLVPPLIQTGLQPGHAGKEDKGKPF
jgi:hypothetical protein